MAKVERTLLNVGRVLNDRYIIDEGIARGGYATVYGGRRLSDDHPVAIKALHTDLIEGDPNAVKRFAREAAVAEHLDHPHLVRIYDHGETDDQILYIIMERLTGKTLSHRIRGGPSSPDYVRSIVIQLLRALDAAHAQGLVHRDLKPANIFLCDPHSLPEAPDAASEHVKILDFGFVKVIPQPDTDPKSGLIRQLTRADQRVGTPGYMAPEMLRTGGVTTKCDLYAVGVVGYELLLGNVAYSGRGIQRAMAQLDDAPNPLPANIQQNPIYLPIRRLMALQPEHRYATASDALIDFERVDIAGKESMSTKKARRRWLKFW